MWEIAYATTHPAAQSFPPNSTSMDALVVGLAPKKGASRKNRRKKITYHDSWGWIWALHEWTLYMRDSYFIPGLLDLLHAVVHKQRNGSKHFIGL